MLLAQSRTQIRAMLADEMTGSRRLLVRARFRNLLAVKIDNETVRDADFVRRAIVQRDAGHERRLKPAAMLIGRFEIHVGRIAQLGVQRANGFMRNAAVDPDVDRIVAFRCARRKPELARKIASSDSNQMFEPRSATRSASFRIIFASRIASPSLE